MIGEVMMTKSLEAVSKSLQFISSVFDKTAEKTEPILKNADNIRQLNSLEQQITLFMQNKKFKVFHFTSSREGEGVSSVVAGLAQIMARRGLTNRILVIDANFHSPALHAVFNTPQQPGFKDLLNDSSLSVTHQIQPGILEVMPCGRGDIDHSIAARQETLIALISSLKSKYDCIIIDSPPLLTSPDALSLALVSDVSILVIQAKRTLWEVAQKSKTYLEQNGCLIGGVVLNRVEHVIPAWIYRRF
jgi:capsular exopolysaccharide synthesis family protein